MQTRFFFIPATFALAAAAFAQVPVAQKIGIIDMQSALVTTKDGQKAVADLRAKFGPKDADMQKRQTDLQAKQEQYRKTQNALSDEAKTKAEREIDSLGKILQRDTEDAKQDMDRDQQRLTQELGGKLMQVVTKYATDNQFSLVWDVSGQPDNILWSSGGIDITREIIALYDKNPPAAPAASAPAASVPAASSPAAAAPSPK